MKKEKREELYQKAIEKWGVVSQIEMLNEESTELALAVRKYIRHWKSDDIKYVINLVEEIADVEIMIEQVCSIHPHFRDKIEEIKEFKLQRLEKRINK